LRLLRRLAGRYDAWRIANFIAKGKNVFMAALFRVFWQIALLRRGPQSLPASRELLLLLLAIHWLTGTLLAIGGMAPELAMLSALAGTLLMVALVHGLLIMHRHHSRVTQTLSALAGCEVLLGLMAFPLGILLGMGSGAQSLVGMLGLILLGWNIAIAAHIFRHSLGVSQVMGFLFAAGYIMISISLSSFFIPVEAPA